jgi:hypothetical protein
MNHVRTKICSVGFATEQTHLVLLNNRPHSSPINGVQRLKHLRLTTGEVAGTAVGALAGESGCQSEGSHVWWQIP